MITATDIYKPEQWHDFFLLVGTGAAALTGLVFVAVSINLKAVARHPVHSYRAISLVGGFAAVFIRCALVLMGGQNHVAVGVELLIVCAFVVVISLTGYPRSSGGGRGLPRANLYRSIGGASCYLVEIVGSVVLISGSIAGLYVAAVAMVVGFYFLFSGSWLLLVGASSADASV